MKANTDRRAAPAGRAVTDLTLAAPQIADCGREGADEHSVRPVYTLPVCSPELQV